MEPPRLETGAGSVSDRRWHASVTVVAWLLVVQSGLSIIFGLVTVAAAPGLASGMGTLNQLPGMLPGMETGGFDALRRFGGRLALLGWLQVLANGLLLAGAIGLLGRRRWGWYLVVVLHLGTVFATMFFVPSLLTPLLGVVAASGSAAVSAWLIALLLALVPISVIVFLMLTPVLRQFERPVP